MNHVTQPTQSQVGAFQNSLTIRLPEKVCSASAPSGFPANLLFNRDTSGDPNNSALSRELATGPPFISTTAPVHINALIPRARRIGSYADKNWNVMYERLVAYERKHGTCLVPRRYKEDTKLGNWVQTQRMAQNCISNFRKERLNFIGFCWKANNRSANRHTIWNAMLKHLIRFRTSNGHCDLPIQYPPDPQLGRWVERQRSRKKQLAKEDIAAFDVIGFRW